MERMVLKAETKTMEECFTCFICNNYYDRATSIMECLHTFCKNCIEDKLIQENLRACPVCKVDLGVAPLDKLRPDFIKDDLRLKLFKPKPESSIKASTKTIAPSLQSSKKKEKSLPSSRVLSTPHVVVTEKLVEQAETVPQIPKQIKKFRRRGRKDPDSRKNDTGSEPEQLPHQESEENGFKIPKPYEKNGFKIHHNMEQENALAEAATSEGYKQKENNSEKLSISSDLFKIPKPYKKNDTGLYLEQLPYQETENGFKIPLNIKQDNALTKAATFEGYIQKENNSEKPPLSSDLFKSLTINEKEKEVMTLERNDTPRIVEPEITPNGKENQDYVHKPNVETEEVSSEKPKKKGKEKQEVVPESVEKGKEKEKEKRYSLRSRKRNRATTKNQACSSQDVVPMEVEEASNINRPVWFSLIASEDQITDNPLPQVKLPYLWIKNGNIPISAVKIYLKQKLDLESEDEVEIWLKHEPVSWSQRLTSLVDWWMQTTPISERETAIMPGESAAEFIMVLFYSRKESSDFSD